VVEVQKQRRSHLTAEELSEFKAILLAKRRELVEDMVNLESEATRTGNDGGSISSTMPIHMADIGTDTWEQEFTLNLIEKERLIVREIDEALDRIENKTFGTCLATGKAIAKARLRVKPWAQYCIEYARKREQGLS
jgi:RNA polymerase-binding protein DksA